MSLDDAGQALNMDELYKVEQRPTCREDIISYLKSQGFLQHSTIKMEADNGQAQE